MMEKNDIKCNDCIHLKRDDMTCKAYPRWSGSAGDRLMRVLPSFLWYECRKAEEK